LARRAGEGALPSGQLGLDGFEHAVEVAVHIGVRHPHHEEADGLQFELTNPVALGSSLIEVVGRTIDLDD
jgi:hypothetical protein